MKTGVYMGLARVLRPTIEQTRAQRAHTGGPLIPSFGRTHHTGMLDVEEPTPFDITGAIEQAMIPGYLPDVNERHHGLYPHYTSHHPIGRAQRITVSHTGAVIDQNDATVNQWMGYGLIAGVGIGWVFAQTILAAAPVIAGIVATAGGIVFITKHLFDCDCGPCPSSADDTPQDVQSRCEKNGAIAGGLLGGGWGLIAAGNMPVALVLAALYGFLYFESHKSAGAPQGAGA